MIHYQGAEHYDPTLAQNLLGLGDQSLGDALPSVFRVDG